MPARLVSLDGTGDIPIDGALLLVGRHRRCDVTLESRRVSRIHCCLLRHRDEFTVRDLGSSNGTRINGRLAGTGRLRPGDELTIAHLRYRLEADKSESAEASTLASASATARGCAGTGPTDARRGIAVSDEQ
jgi:predicted component of type VI protein secretion system